MSSNTEFLPETEPTRDENNKLLKPYCKPQLIEFGDLRTLTLGASQVTTFESGGVDGAEFVYIP